MNTFFKRIRSNRGQTATEYMLIVAVIVVGLIASASVLIPKFKKGVNKLGDHVDVWLEEEQEKSGPND